MKICTEHESACDSALASRGMITARSLAPGGLHTDVSALEQVLLSAAYGRFGIRAMREDMCPLCELGDEADKLLSDAADEVARRRRL